MPTFEPLRPRGSADYLTIDSPLESEPTFSPLAPERPAVNRPMVSNVGDQLPSPFDVSGDFAGLGSPVEQPDGLPKSFRSDALHNIGVNWAEGTSGEQRPFTSKLGFYDLDYDTKGRRGVELGKGADYIEAANVFGRQFTRAELEKDDEGRKLIKLMEAQRTGSHQEAGFWKGMSDWNLGNVPWLGWMMDVGSTVSETISISKTMRKMQNGEAVSNHEAIAVRRFMLQQELESQRSTSYQIGSTIRSSVPFVVEIAGAAAMTAAAAKVGAWVGGAIAGIGSGGVLSPVGAAVGGAIGAVGGFIFGGGVLLSKLFKGGAKKAATKFATNTVMESLAERTLAEGITQAERRAAVQFAAGATGRTAKEISNAALQTGMVRASESIGRELAERKLGSEAVKGWTAEQFAAYAVKNAASKDIRKRAVFEASKWVGESFKDVADIAMDARLARTFLVNGDVANMVERGWVTTLEKAALDKVYGNAPRTVKDGFWTGIRNYWADRAAVRGGLDRLTGEEINALKQQFLTSMMDKAAGRPSAVSAVTASISQSLGGHAVSRGYASDVAEYLVNNATRSFMLKYKGKGFVNGATRVARWVGDGILDGMLRWDTSIYHGAGTIARSGSVLGGKMSAFKEALKASFVEAPVRGTMQLGMQMPMWPVAAAVTGNDPRDFVVRGQLGTQATALQTGDRQMMDNARAIAIGSGLVEYISEASGRGFNIMMEGVASPVLKNAPFLKATKEIGSYMSRKLESVFGTQEMMKYANRSRLVDAVSGYLGRKAAEGVRLPNITRTQVEQLVAGVKDVANVGEVLNALGLKSEKALVKQAMVSQLGLSKMRAGMTYFVAHNMLERGLTPQKMASWLQRVGYDGVVAEMAEERYGGFFQGLMGLDDSPSDSTMRDRWSAAMRGLFPDPHQLVVEAASFSFPAMTQLTMNSLYSHLGRGVVQETLDDARSVSVHQNTVPEFTMPVASAEGAQALAAYHSGAQALYDKATIGEGGEEKAWSDVLGHGRTAAGSMDKELAQNARDSLAAAIADIEGPEVDAAGNMTGLRKRAKRLDMTKDFDREIVEDEIEHILSHAGSAEDAAARGNMYGAPPLAQKWLREEWNRRHASAETGEESLLTRVQAIKASVADGSLKLNDKNKDISNPKVSDEEMEVLLREKAQRIIDLSNTEAELNKQLSDHQAEEVFGADGVEAIRRLWRKDPSHMDSVKQKALGEGSEYAEFVKNAPNVELRPDADADSVASEITAALPFVSNDSAMTAEVRERLSVRQGVQFNKFSEDYVGEVAGSLGRLGDKYLQFKYNLGRNQWWGRRALMRVIGILDAITTGRLELASRNPVQWAMEEAQLPRQLMNEVGQLRERAIQAGRELYLRRRFGNGYMDGEEARKIRETSLADTSADLMEEFRKAGEESYQTSLRDYAQMFLTARNVIAVSKGDIEDAALRVVAHNHRDEAGGKVIYRYGDKTTDDFRSAEFRAAVAGEEMEKAKSDIVKGLARLAVGDAVAINTHSRFGNVNTTSVTFSYDRAMRFGNNAEVVAAIRAMPAFRNMRAVYDVSDGGHVNDYALGRTIDVGELLNLNTDGMLEPGDLRRVMFAMGRYYGEFTESQNQQAAAQYLSRLRLAVENSEPLSFEFRDGTSADVKTSYGLDKDGRRVVTLTCNGVSVTGRSTLEAARLLETAVVPKADGTRPEVDGVLANWRQFAVLQNDSISSRDATSLVLLMHGTREKAREAYRAFYGHDVDEALYPPQLRRVTRGGVETWLYEDEEEAARGLATELRSEDEGVRNAVRGNGREGDPMSIGYERAAELMLERHGITRSKQDAAATDVYRGDASYSIRPNGIAFGDTIYLQSDYYSGGDAEMMLRSAFARAIFDAATKPGKAFDDPSAFVGILQEMDRAFTKAADECVAELEDRNPDMAQRVKDAMASLPSSPGRVDPARMAAIAAAVGVFSDERGVNEYGNGFLFGPELAYVADRARRSPWTLLFLSSMDEALGGRGFFAEDADPLQGLGRFVDAFAPGGPELMASRASAMFTNGGEGARKTGIVFQWYGIPKDISAAGIAAGVSPVVDESTLTNFTDVKNFNVRALLSTVAGHCREFGDAYRKAGGTISNAEMYRILKHALAGGGETADEVAPSIGSGFGGVSLETDARVRQPLASDIVPDDVAFGIGRNLQFLAPGTEVGGVGGRAQALKSRSAVRRFLFERGCYSSNAERIVNKFVDAAGAEGGAGVSDAALDEEEWTSLADVLSDGSGNQDIFFDAKRANAAIENRDLMDLGRQWSYIYPSEGGAFTQVLARFSNEILRLAEKDEAADELKTLARLFNVLRYKRSGKSGGSISAATGVWNDSSRVAKDTKITDALLAKAIVALHASGHDELAFVLNGIRNIPAEGKRRAQALALIGYMTPLDVNRVTVGDTGIGALDTMGSAGLAAVSSVRASLSHTLSRMFPRVAGGHRTTPDELYKSISVLDNLLLLSGSEKFFEKDKAGTPFSKLTIAEYESILAKAREGSDAKNAFMKNPSDDKALVAFANALASRMSAVADAVDYVLGPGNELTYALRSPDIVGGVVRSVRNAKDDSLKNVVDRLVQLFDSCAESKESGSRCPLISHALLNPAVAAIQRAVAAKGAAPLQGRRQYSDITTHGLSAVDILNALSDDHIACLFSRGDPMPQGAPRSQWFKNRLPGGVVNSYMGRVFGLYAASAPRSVARMSGVREESLEASSQVTATPASEPVMMAAVEDRLLSPLGVLDGYLQRGGRFEDGSRLVTVTAGARLEDGTIVDKSQLSVIVAAANIDRFVKGDVRNGYFEVYHGEKPSVYSISLPRDVMQKILDGIHSGADWAMNRVTRKMLEDKEHPLPKTIDAPDNRERLYDALFSVVATAARCDQIDPKRTQVLLAQGVPFSTHRDRMLKTVDGKVEEVSAAVSTMDGKAKVTPGLYCDIIVSGTDAAQNLGMYLNHGFLIESQRAQATNPLSVSFKNHLIDWFGAALFKGQGHDFGLGMYETDAVPVSGTLAEACRVQRRRLEEILGIKELTLDLPDPEKPQTDEEKAYRESALKLVEEFLLSSTTLCTDTETLKAGAFSSRCGFKAEKGKPFTVKACGKEIVFQLEERDGKPPRLLMTVDGQKVRMFGRTMVTPEFKNGGAPLSTMLPAIAFALGKKELSDEDVGSIEAEWLLPTGETTEVKALKDSGIFQSYGTEEGDKVSVVESSSGGYRVRYFTRSMNAQVMANSDASAKPSLEHPAATNWARDVVANSGRVRRAVPGQADFTWYATKALNVSRAVPYAILRSQPDFVRSLIERDPELYAAWMAHPNSQEVQEQIVRRANTAYAKAMKAYVNSVHAVLMGSGIKATKTDRQADGTYNVEYSYSAGVTDYDKGCFRDARVLSQEEKEAFGVGRSYSSGQVNVLSANFRYGWHVKADADFSAIDAYAQGAGRKAYEANLSRLEQAYGDVDEDMKRVASLAAYIEYFDGPSCRGEAKEAAAKVLGSVFTDYTGKTVGENASCDIMKLSFSDLFLGQRYGGSRFDLAAFEFRGDTHGKKYDRNGNKTIYLGGAFFAGDRRPSGNFESASGLIRVQSPVLFDRATGKVDDHALYILPPLMNLTQGSDTDGDSATGTVMSGRGLTADDRLILDQIHDTVMARMKDLGSDEWTRLLRCEDLVNTLRTRFPDYFEEGTDGNGVKFMKPSAKLHQLIGNVLMQEEIDNYRLMPNETQTAYGTMDVNKAASSRTIYDYGLIGRSPVGTQAVSDDIDIQIGGAASRLAATVLDVPEDSLAGKSYYSVFKECIDKLSLRTMPELDLLNPRVAAYLSWAAADAGLPGMARARAVSLQAALEHLTGYADTDPRVRALAPALFEEYDGYRPAEDFIGHLDKISNALFDVVKDLFAPRASWQAGLMNCLVSRLLADANAEYKAWVDGGRKGESPKWDDEWFFVKLVGFAQELHASNATLPSLIAKGNAFSDYSETSEFVPGKVNQTLLGAYNTMLLRSKDCVAKTAFKGLYMVRDGRLDLTDNGRVKDVSGQSRLTNGLTVKNASGEWVSARGPAVRKGIQGLMSSIARALRMRESDFVDDAARDRALALGWRPATDFMDEKLCNDIADVLEGKVDGRVAVRDPASKVAIGLRFLGAKDVPSALEEAQRDLRAFQALNDVLDIEDGLSPDTVLQNGGSRASGQLKKIESAQQGGAAVANEMTLVYLGSKMRMEDIASGRNPLAADRSIGRDLDAVELSPSDWSSYLSRTGQRPMSATDSQGNPANDEALLFMAAASFAGDYVDTGVVQANRLNLSHILGCVRAGVQKFGGAQYSQFVLDNYGKFASALNALVEEALNRGTAAGMSQNVVDMLTMLRPNVKRNTVDLVLRASADAAKVLRTGFQELAANQNAVGGGFTGAGLAACIQLSMCANSQFDPARDSNVRANVSAMFGEEVDEWERWGAAVPQNPVLRQLCRVPRLPSTGGYNLFVQRMQHLDPELAKKVAAVSGMPEVTDADLNHPATQSLTTPFAVLNYIAMTDYTSPHALHDEAAESDPRFLPGGEQRRRLTSVYAEGESHALRPQTSVPNVMFRGPSGEFQTVEEAVNDIMRERLASYASDKRMAAWLADPRNLTRSFNQVRLSTRFADESDREMYAATGRAPRGTVRKVPLNFDNVIDEVLERAWIDYGEQFAEWARNAAFDGGETLSEIASPLMRGKLKSFVQAHAETALEAPSIGSAPVDPTFTVQRMRRGGFFQFLEGKHPEDMDRFVHDPEVNIRGALEAVFGDWSKETGCKVERVTGKNGVPMNLLKITRKIRLKGSLPEPRPVSYSREERASAYKALASKEYADAHPKAVEIARDMLRNGVPVSTIDAGLFTKTDLASWPVTGLTIHTKEDAANLCRMLSNPYFEVSKLLFVDKQGKVISGVITEIGSSGSVHLQMKDLEKIIPPGAFGVIASHNHPNGSPKPSHSDSKALPAQREAFEKAGLKFLDHIITDTTQSYSMEAGGFDYAPYKMSEGVSEWWRGQEKLGSTVQRPTDPFTLVDIADQIRALYKGELTSGLRDLAQTLSTHDKRGSFIAGMDSQGRITGIARLLPGKMMSAIEAVKESERLILFVGSAPFDRRELYAAVRTDTDNQRGSERSLWGVYSLETGYSILTPDNSDYLYKFTYGEFTPTSWENDSLESEPSVSSKKPYHEIVTYISYGDYLSMKANNANYNQEILNALNERADQKMTMDELMSLAEEERVALANVAGLRVKGESVKATRYLGTKALMALTGLVRLSDVSDYHTLFHEYFHQMLDFYRKTGICTAEDEAELLKKYRTADGRFDEEAAADAFADYVTRTDEGTGRGKVLSAGFGGDDKLFAKFKRTAQAFLSGAMAYDSLGVPAFMKMMISADFSQRDMKEMQDFDDAQQKKIERLLLGENVDFGAPSRWESVDGELKDDGYALANALTMYKGGLVGIDEVKAAAQKFVEDGKKPENRVTFNAIMNIDRPPAPADVAKPEPGPTLAQRISDPAIPIGDRVSLLFKEALKRLGNGTSESVDLTEAMNKFRDLSDIGEAAGPDFDLATYTARRALNHVCEMLGVNIWDYAEDGTKSLNDLGRQLMSDEKIAGFIVRLVHEYSVKRTSENDYAGDLATVPTKDRGTWGPERPVDTITPAQFASADYVMGNMLAGVVPSKWTEFCRGRAEASRDLFIKAAEDLEARAAAMRSRFPNGDIPEDVERDAKWLELQGADARHRAHDVVTLVEGVMNGHPLKGLILAMGPEGKNTLKPRKGWSSEQEFSNYYGYLLQYITGAARMERQNDGTVRYAPGKAFGFHNAVVDFSSRFVQEAIDAAAKALGVAQVVRRYVKENGVDQPAPGEHVSIPVDADGAPLAMPPVEGVMEPDLHPQLILQLPGSWQAADLQKQFYGGAFRDMMTDVSLNAAVEETNRLANRIDFYLGANCMPGESANEIEETTSELGTEDGLFTAEEKNRHSVRRVAGVRGYLLGLVNRAAKTKGRAMTQEDVNLVHFVSQAIACHACGHAMYTGYDIPYVNRTILDGLLANVKSVSELEKATAEGGVYSPEAVFDRIYGHVSSAGRPSNLDQLLCRVLEGVPRSVLGWENGKFRKDGIYCKFLEAFYITGRNRTDGTQVGDYDFNQRVGALLMEAGLADRSAATGRVVLTIPVAEVKRAWEAKDSYRQELIDNCGRRAELLDIDYLAEVVAAEANRLNKVAGRSRWLTDSAVGTTLSGMARGLWFEAGTGHHQAIVDHLKNARELFRGEISSDERLRNSYAALQDTLRSHNKEVTHRRIVTGPDGTPVEKKERAVQGNLPAFELGRDGQLANISNRQLMYLGRLLGLGRRMADVDTFIKNIFAGNFTKEKTGSIYGFDIRKDMTVFEFDWLMFNVLSAHIVTEAEHPDDPGHTPLTQAYDDGGCGYGHQQLVDIYYLHGQLQQKLMDDSEADGAVRGRVCSMSEQDMFRTQGKLGSAKSATERLRSMAEAITHAERFRGCLAQMLTTVGTDGAPNFIVKPGEYAQDLVPDEFWQATSRFVLDRMRGLGKMVAYDAGKTGLENMRMIADAAAAIVRDKAKDKAKPRYHLLPPNELGADMLFDSILCADDDASDDVNVLTKFANGRLFHPNGSEAEGYMRQLFGMVSRPTVWAGHRILDRVMSYSKAASVGLSAFFAFATRFESPVAACGFWNTAMGYRKNTAKLARRLANSKLGEALGFRKNLPYLADFLEAITSDDPAIQHMRELCDLINMPLTDSVMNPLTEKQGAIDAEIDRISRWLMAEGHTKMAKELRSAMKAAFHNPGEYAFSNVLNGVKMAVVAQTMFRLREECEHAGRPFDPVRELRRHSAYINAEIGGIQPERYAFLTPGMQQLLRLGMFSYQWTLGAWVAGSGEVVSDILFGGHHTTEATRQRAFIRWLRMLGIVKVGVPVFMQLAIKSLATALVKSGMVGDPDDPDDKDPLGIDDMPWLCFFNESKVGSLAFDITPITKLLGQQDYSPAVGAGVLGALGGLAMGGLKGAVVGAAGAAGATAGLRSAGVTLVDVKNGRGVFPYVSTVVGTAAGAALTRKWWGALAGGFAGRNIGALIPVSEGVGRGANTTGRRRQYMHFGKQNDEFWRWFTDWWGQATNKMSIPMQKVVEAFFGSTNGQNFGKKFSEKSLTERFFTTSLDPNESAVVNFLTGFLPFSAASVAGHPDTGVLGMVGPVNQGTSKTRSQKEIRSILTDFVRDDRHNDPWSFPGNRQNLSKLCALALKEARMNGLDPDELLTSALGQVTSQEYIRLFEALPRTVKDEVDARSAKAALRALYRVNRKKDAILQSLKKKYKNAGVDWSKQKNAAIRAAVKDFLGESRADPWVSDDEVDELFERHFAEPSFQQLRSVDVQQDRKGGEAFSNFLATDDVPETLFGIPVVSQDYTEEDLEFFKRNPKAAGFYDLGDESEYPPDDPPPGDGPMSETADVDEDRRIVQQAAGGGNTRGGKTYDTSLTREQEAKYQAWRSTLPKPLQYEGDYDLRGYWLDPNTVKDGIKNGQHFTDTYKKPNHPTFSVESKYAVGDNIWKAGSWDGDKFTPPNPEVKSFMDRNPSLFSHVKSFEKMWEKPYEDVGGYAIGYGAHTDKSGKPVTKDTASIDEATATSMLARDLYTRREKLAKMLPNWGSIPGNARQALLDVAMGKDNILSASESKGLHGDLAAAGKDPAKLLAAVKKHYYSYLTQDPKLRKGLMARRIAGGKLFFGEDFSYDGKKWNPKLGFVKKGGK